MVLNASLRRKFEAGLLPRGFLPRSENLEYEILNHGGQTYGEQGKHKVSRAFGRNEKMSEENENGQVTGKA
jgi:hypothetical protein